MHIKYNQVYFLKYEFSLFADALDKDLLLIIPIFSLPLSLSLWDSLISKLLIFFDAIFNAHIDDKFGFLH